MGLIKRPAAVDLAIRLGIHFALNLPFSEKILIAGFDFRVKLFQIKWPVQFNLVFELRDHILTFDHLVNAIFLGILLIRMDYEAKKAFLLLKRKRIERHFKWVKV